MFERFDEHEKRLAGHTDDGIVETQTHPTRKQFLHHRFCTTEQNLRMLLIDRLSDEFWGKKELEAVRVVIHRSE